VTDAQLGALAHGGLGDLRPRRDDDRVHAAGNRLQVVVALLAVDLVGVRVDREHLVAPFLQPLMDYVAAVAGRFA
jgi:hypothetical protein